MKQVSRKFVEIKEFYQEEIENNIENLVDEIENELFNHFMLIDANTLLFELKKDGMLTKELEEWLNDYIRKAVS